MPPKKTTRSADTRQPSLEFAVLKSLSILGRPSGSTPSAKAALA